MKNLISTFLFFCLIHSFQAQTNVFQPYDLNNAEWYYQTIVFDGSTTNYYYSHRHWGGDTIIEGQTYVKTNVGAIRQDVSNQTLFYRNADGLEFDVSIDQFLEVGDTLFLTPHTAVATGVDLLSYFYMDSFAIVQAIDSISFMGDYRKSYIFHTENNPLYPAIELVLGLGVIHASGFEHGDNLICYSTENQLLYGASENPLSINCTAKTDELEQVDFTIFPNPASNQIEIQLATSNISYERIRVTDVQGKVITKINPFQSHEISISDWENGVYIISIESNGYSTTKRFVKMN